MAKFNIDLKKFKHVSSDDKSTTLRHKDGHEMKIHHKALSTEFQKQLEALPREKMSDGGEPEQPHWDSYRAPKPRYVDTSTTVTHKTSQEQRDSEQKQRNAANAASDAKMRAPQSKEESHEDEGYTDYNSGGVIDTIKNFLAPDFQKAEEEKPKQKNIAIPQSGTAGPTTVNKAEGGEVNKHEHEQTPYDKGLPCKNPNCKSHGTPHPNCRCYGGNMASGGSISKEYFCDKPRHHFSNCEYAEGGEVAHYYEGTDEVSDKEIQEAADEAQKPVDETVETPPHMEKLSEPAPLAEDNPEQEDQEAMKVATQGQPEEQPQQAPKAPVRTSDPMANFARSQQELAQGPNIADKQQMYSNIKNNVYQKQMQENQAFAQDLANGHITPETYQSLFAKQSTPEKIGTLFGLLIGGAGSGLTHQPNVILGMMDQQIKNDLAAQQHNKENALNFMRVAQAHGLNEANIGNIGSDAALKIQAHAYNNTLQSSFQSLVDKVKKMPEGPDKVNAMNGLAMMYPQVQDKIKNMTDLAASAQAYQAMVGMNQNTGPAGLSPVQKQRRAQYIMGNPNPVAAASEYDTSHSIPGVPGQSDLSVPQDVRDKVINHNILDNRMRDLIDYVAKHKGTIKPGEIALATQKADEVRGFYNKTVDNLGLTKGRLDSLKEQISKNPTNIFGIVLGNTEKLKEILNSNAARKTVLLKGYNFPVETTTKTKVVPGVTHDPVIKNGKIIGYTPKNK